MSTPLAVLVGGGHTRYLLQAADRVAAHLRNPRTVARNCARRAMGDTPAVMIRDAVLEASGIEVEEDIREVVKILDERGVVP